METTQNFQDFEEAMASISLISMAKIKGLIEALENKLTREQCSELYDLEYDVKYDLDHFFERVSTNKICPRCGKKLYKSDLPQYDYVCAECEENFYEFEIKEETK